MQVKFFVEATTVAVEKAVNEFIITLPVANVLNIIPIMQVHPNYDGVLSVVMVWYMPETDDIS